MRYLATSYLVPFCLAVAALGFAGGAGAQFSGGYQFLKAVKDKNVIEANNLMSQPGSTLVNSREPDTGETALHLVTRRRDLGWMGFLLNGGANPNIGDRDGNTPLMMASTLGFADGIDLLLVKGANINAQNNNGETALIKAVQARSVPIVQRLVSTGADPDIADHIAGLSARDYAERDNRARRILSIIEAGPTEATAAKADAAP